VDTCRGLLGTMTSGSKSVRNALERSIVCGDALTMDWTAPFAGVFRERGGFDLVIGNPPFLNQLEGGDCARSIARCSTERAVWGRCGGVRRSLCTLPADRLSDCAKRSEGPRWAGRPSFSRIRCWRRGIVPRYERKSVRECTVEALWIAGERVFDAGVLGLLPLSCGRRAPGSRLRLYRGRDVKACGTVRARHDDLCRAPTWAPLGATAMGVPEFKLDASNTLGDMAEATADFRDQFYGLKGCVCGRWRSRAIAARHAPAPHHNGPHRRGEEPLGISAHAVCGIDIHSTTRES
jgi:hypothetical protein